MTVGKPNVTNPKAQPIYHCLKSSGLKERRATRWSRAGKHRSFLIFCLLFHQGKRMVAPAAKSGKIYWLQITSSQEATMPNMYLVTAVEKPNANPSHNPSPSTTIIAHPLHLKRTGAAFTSVAQLVPILREREPVPIFIGKRSVQSSHASLYLAFFPSASSRT